MMWEMLSITGELSSAYLPLAPAAGAELGESLSHECLALGFGVWSEPASWFRHGRLLSVSSSAGRDEGVLSPSL